MEELVLLFLVERIFVALWGKQNHKDADTPVFGPCRQLDFELEMGCFVGIGNDRGEPIPIEEAENHVFGMVLVNDWSARDIQAWEYRSIRSFLS